mgnify:CR=1 FL=1
MAAVYQYVEGKFREEIGLNEMAKAVNMTVPAFCRYFKRVSGKTFTRFVNEIRVVHACKLLTEKQQTISQICYESGFNNFSHFNRLFKAITGKSPSEYKKQVFDITKRKSINFTNVKKNICIHKIIKMINIQTWVCSFPYYCR